MSDLDEAVGIFRVVFIVAIAYLIIGLAVYFY